MDVLGLIVLGLLVLGVGLAIYEWRKGIKIRYDHRAHARGQTEADRQKIRTEDEIRHRMNRH